MSIIQTLIINADAESRYLTPGEMGLYHRFGQGVVQAISKR